MDFIYIMFKNHDGNPEIYSMWDTYESAIIAYYQYFRDNKYRHLDFMFLCNFPVNKKFCDNSSWSKIKLQKTCPYRIKFKNIEELEERYHKCLRTLKLNRIII